MKMSTCGICDKTSDEVFDGLCKKCESLWMFELTRISKNASPDMLIKDLFSIVTKNTRERYLDTIKK